MARSPHRNATPKPPPPRSRRGLHLLLLFVASVLVADALVGDKGLLETMRARHQYSELAESIAVLRRENARLREHARRLREDPRLIEEIARRDLGLVRPGELLIILTDVPAPAEPAR